MNQIVLPCTFILACLSASLSFGQHETESFSPVTVNGALPYRVELVPHDLGTGDIPSLHSYAKAQWDGKWLLIGGRTNGLHAFTQNGFENFPIAFENEDIWVVDPVNQQTWRRSLGDDQSGLTLAQIDSLAVTNNQFAQVGDRLYITGGYGFKTDFDYVTFDTLTSIDVPGLIEWAQGADTAASDQMRQISDPLFTVTGGAMSWMNGRMHLVFGQDFQGPYTPFGNGVYTYEVRSFSIVDNESGLSVENVQVSEQDERFRRRDLNVVPVMRTNTEGQLREELRVLSGVFTPTGGAWTVPVEVNEQGVPSIADANNEHTFKQAMNQYHSAKLGLYSESVDEMHTLLFGGISLNYVDTTTNELVRDDMLPFVNQSTAIVLDAEGRYTQYLLPSDFPEILDQDSGRQLRLGTNAEFMLADGVATYDNGVIRMDHLDGPTTLGYVFGGIAADQPNNGNTAASGRTFEVRYHPVAYDGDADGNGLVDVADIDYVARAIDLGEVDPSLDFFQTGAVDTDDLRYFVENVFHTWIGDSNLDGEFNSADFVSLFLAGEYEDGVAGNSTWTEGDWNGDTEFDSRDLVFAFIANGYEQGPQKANAVPEPTGIVTLAFLVAFCSAKGRTPHVGRWLG